MRPARTAMLVAASAALASVPVTLASGAQPVAPTVVTAAASGTSGSGTTLNGIVNPNGLPTSYAFQWGPTAGYGHETALTPAGSGTTASAKTATLSSLNGGTAYHFRVLAISSAGTSVGSDATFATSGTPPSPSALPTVATGLASNVGQAGANVSGTVKPNGQATNYYFEYGPTSNFGFQTTPRNGGAGAAALSVSDTLSGLTSSTTYHYRLVAVNPGGTALGSSQTFKTTTPPVVSTGGASGVTANSFVLNGTANPEGRATSYFFQFGTTIAYGSQSAPGSIGAGTANVAVHKTINGISSNTTYHYRLVGQSSVGISYGVDKTVTSSQAGSLVAFIGRTGFVSPSRRVGVGVACFGGTRCTGHLTMSHNGAVIGQRNFNLAPNSGGFQNLRLSRRNARLLKQNRPFHLVAVTVSITTSSGQALSQVMHLARWVWR